MNELILNNSIFENIKHIDENGNEYWFARELQNVLEYKRWDKFNNVITNATISCKNSNYAIVTIFPTWEKWSTSDQKLPEVFLIINCPVMHVT